MEPLLDSYLRSIKSRIFPLTLSSLIYFSIFTAVNLYITEYFLKFKLFKWIYVATVIVIFASLYKLGDDEDAIKDIFKLADI